MDDKNTLKQKWISFCSAFFAPVPVFSILGGGILIALSIKYKDDINFSILINLIGSLLVGIAGAFIKERYDALMNESALIKKGQSAIRNLDSIGRQVVQIRGWIKSFVGGKKEPKNALEEIDRHLSTTEMHIKSGLEDWTDIIPELKRTGEVIKNYQDVIKAYLEELLKNKKELLVVGENKELRERLEKRIKELEKNVKELKKEQPRILGDGGIGTSFVVGSSPFISRGGGFIGLNDKVCSECGKSYSEDPLTPTFLATTFPFRDLCPECKRKVS